MALFCGLVCAIWLAEPHASRMRWVLAIAAVVVVLPTPSTAFWTADVERVRYFANGDADRRFTEKDVVLVVPYGGSGWSMLWQAEAKFAYRMAGGRLGNLPPDEQRWLPILRVLGGAKLTPKATEQLPGFLQQHGVDAIVVVPSRTPSHVERLVSDLGIKPVREGGALVYALRPKER
jgi:hypothetical protein